MKIKDIGNIVFNKRNKQFSLNLRSKELKKRDLTPEQLVNLDISKPKKVKNTIGVPI